MAHRVERIGEHRGVDAERLEPHEGVPHRAGCHPVVGDRVPLPPGPEPPRSDASCERTYVDEPDLMEVWLAARGTRAPWRVGVPGCIVLRSTSWTAWHCDTAKQPWPWRHPCSPTAPSTVGLTASLSVVARAASASEDRARWGKYAGFAPRKTWSREHRSASIIHAHRDVAADAYITFLYHGELPVELFHAACDAARFAVPIGTEGAAMDPLSKAGAHADAWIASERLELLMAWILMILLACADGGEAHHEADPVPAGDVPRSRLLDLQLGGPHDDHAHLEVVEVLWVPDEDGISDEELDAVLAEAHGPGAASQGAPATADGDSTCAAAPGSEEAAATNELRGASVGCADTVPLPRSTITVERAEGGTAGVSEIARGHVGTLRYCHETRLKADPTIAGRLELALRLGPDGRAVPEIVESTVADEEMHACVLARARRWRFPPDSSGAVALVVVFTLDEASRDHPYAPD